MAKAPDLSLAELESLLKEQKGRLDDLKKKQSSLQKELDEVTQEISALEGKGKGRRGRPAGSTNKKKKVRRRRAKNAKPLKAYVTDVLSSSKKGMSLDEVKTAVTEAGYKSKSKNFKSVIYQCLYHTKDFVHDKKKGTYTLKKK